jgi:phospholipase/carboxylesterase
MAPDTRALPHHETAWLGTPPPAGQDVPTLVLLHGYGSNERHMIAIVPALQMFLPGVSARVIAVRASHPAPGRPRGHSWFPGSVMAQPSDSAVGETADRVAAVIRQYSSRAVVLGFSQGMCTAITVLRRHPELVGALIALSGFMFDDDHPGDSRLAVDAACGDGIPAFAGYDPDDPVIPGFASRWAMTFLRTHTDLEERTYPRMGHSVSLDEIRDVTAFLRRVLTANPGRVRPGIPWDSAQRVSKPAKPPLASANWATT